ncbi:MAG: hypothetical protein V4754_11205 [Pseudomonadota bacterium]
MTQMIKPADAASLQVLDPCLLGRPVHLLPRFAAQLREDLTLALRQPMNRRYWGPFQIASVAFARVDGSEEPGRWLQFSVTPGHVGFALQRSMLLCVLNYRYGRSGAKPGPAPDPATVRVTATEERLSVVLGQQLAATLAMRVRANLANLSKGGAGPIADLKALPGVVPARGSWVIAVTLEAGGGGEEGAARETGKFWFSLDKAVMADVLHGLLPERVQTKKSAANARPLASRLQVTLEGRMVSQEVALGTLFDLRVGDVIPISLSRTDVLLAESRLFTAAVSEHKGKLCLTSFEDAD